MVVCVVGPVSSVDADNVSSSSVPEETQLTVSHAGHALANSLSIDHDIQGARHSVMEGDSGGGGSVLSGGSNQVSTVDSRLLSSFFTFSPLLALAVIDFSPERYYKKTL